MDECGILVDDYHVFILAYLFSINDYIYFFIGRISEIEVLPKIVFDNIFPNFNNSISLEGKPNGVLSNIIPKFVGNMHCWLTLFFEKMKASSK